MLLRKDKNGDLRFEYELKQQLEKETEEAVKNLSPEEKRKATLTALGGVILFFAFMLWMFRPTYYCVIQAVRFVYYSVVWVGDLLGNGGAHFIDYNPFYQLFSMSYDSFCP